MNCTCGSKTDLKSQISVFSFQAPHRGLGMVVITDLLQILSMWARSRLRGLQLHVPLQVHGADDAHHLPTFWWNVIWVPPCGERLRCHTSVRDHQREESLQNCDANGCHAQHMIVLMVLVRMLMMMVETRQCFDPWKDSTHNRKKTTTTNLTQPIALPGTNLLASLVHPEVKKLLGALRAWALRVIRAFTGHAVAKARPANSLTVVSRESCRLEVLQECKRQAQQMRPGLPSGFFHTACVEFLSVSTSVLLLLFLVSLDSVLSASGRHHDLFGTSCQRLAEKKHGDPVVVTGHYKSHWLCRQCRFCWLSCLVSKQPACKMSKSSIFRFRSLRRTCPDPKSEARGSRRNKHPSPVPVRLLSKEKGSKTIQHHLSLAR